MQVYILQITFWKAPNWFTRQWKLKTQTDFQEIYLISIPLLWGVILLNTLPHWCICGCACKSELTYKVTPKFLWRELFRLGISNFFESLKLSQWVWMKIICNSSWNWGFNRILRFENRGVWHYTFATCPKISTTAEHLSISAHL